MPPDDFSGGRDRHVRDVTAPFFQNASSAVFVNFSSGSPPITPDSTPPTSHSLAAKSAMKLSSIHKTADDIWTYSARPIYPNHPNTPPLLTPRSSSDSLHFQSQVASRHSPTFVDSVFPLGLKAVERIHSISSSQLPQGLEGAIVDRDTGTRSVYIYGLSSAVTSNDIKDLVVRVLDLADEEIEADEVIFVLEKSHGQLRELLQGLLYVGGSVVKNQEEVTSDSVVLVGIEI